ncbi:MAG: hypothetical protein JF616_20770 [Fibrobacteres bacterium]|nr:hypothetical protein [Fibrobacterota bacterium]
MTRERSNKGGVSPRSSHPSGNKQTIADRGPMNRINRILNISGAACLSGTLLALLGCQQEAPNETRADSKPDYALEVQKLKAGSEDSFDKGLVALDRKFGFPAASAEEVKPQDATALGKAASTQVFTATGNCAQISKFVFHAVPGDEVVFRATSLNVINVGTSDPVAVLIQFNNSNFINNGVVPALGQASFKILAWNDDAGPGDLSSFFNYTFQAGENGYFMVMVYPYSNSSSAKTVSLNMDLIRPSCPTCDFFIQNPIRKLGGLVYNSRGANDFHADPVGPIIGVPLADPHLYVIMNSLGTGMSNGNIISFVNGSRVFPYFVSLSDGFKTGNIVLIDNDAAGTESIQHTQFFQ